MRRIKQKGREGTVRAGKSWSSGLAWFRATGATNGDSSGEYSGRVVRDRPETGG